MHGRNRSRNRQPRPVAHDLVSFRQRAASHDRQRPVAGHRKRVALDWRLVEHRKHASLLDAPSLMRRWQ
jgi:hypothetical protein